MRLRREAPGQEAPPPSSSRTAWCCALQTSFPGVPSERLRPERSFIIRTSTRTCTCTRARTNRQSALRDQFHGAVNRNPHRAFAFIHPVVGGQRPVLILDQRSKFGALAGFEAWLRKTSWIITRHYTGISLRRSQRAQGRLVRTLITVEGAVHAEHDEKDDDAERHQARKKIQGTARTHVLLFEALVIGYMIGHVLIGSRLIRDLLVTHGRAPIRPARWRRKPEPEAANSGYGRSTQSRFRPWRRESRFLRG